MAAKRSHSGQEATSPFRPVIFDSEISVSAPKIWPSLAIEWDRKKYIVRDDNDTRKGTLVGWMYGQDGPRVASFERVKKYGWKNSISLRFHTWSGPITGPSKESTPQGGHPPEKLATGSARTHQFILSAPVNRLTRKNHFTNNPFPPTRPSDCICLISSLYFHPPPLHSRSFLRHQFNS
jgi:hypothetical protein